MSGLGWRGALLFSFIPAVLFLYLRQPFGPGISLALGISIMLGHRLLAAPWTERHSRERCLWCGRRAPHNAVEIPISGGRRDWIFKACSRNHRRRLEMFFTFVNRFRFAIRAGIFIPLAILLAGSLLAAAGHPALSLQSNVLQFRLIVAATVVSTSIGYLAIRRPAASLACPFPIHNLFLLGVGNTLWIFRGVGLWWLVLVARAILDA